MMAYNSSTSPLTFSSSTSESSLSSSPCSCSSPSSLPQPPPQYVSKFSVPFLWEEKPGITKPPPSSSSLKPCTNIFYGNSLELPPLPPPPCLSQAFPRSRASKLTEAKPSKEEQLEDPFFLALKACTKVENTCSRDVSKASFEGLQVAFKPTSKGQKSMESKRGDSKKTYEDSGHHQTRRGVSFNHYQTRRGVSFNEEGNGRGKLSTHGILDELLSIEEKASRVETRRPNLLTIMLEKDELLSIEEKASNGTLHELLSIEEKASRVETRGPNLHTSMLEKDEESTKGAHHHMNAAGKASSNGLLVHGNKAKKEDPLQGVHSKPPRREHLVGAEVGGHSKLREIIADGHRKPKHNNVKAYNALDRISEGHSKAKHRAKVVEFIYCRGY